MSTATLEKSGAVPAAMPLTELLVEVFLDQIEPSPFNRKKFNEKQLEELAASIVLTDGVIEPVILRRIEGSKASYQLVAGERRWLASKRAVEKMGFQRKTIKSIVKTLTDAQAIELTLIENAQREDVHPLELCKTYKALMGEKDSTTGKPYTRELIAERVKKSYSLVCNILQADQLGPEIQKACLDGKISGSIALEICKYQPQDQDKIFLQCFGGAQKDAWNDDTEYGSIKEVAKDKDAESSVSVRRLRDWIANNIHIDLTKAPFSTTDELLLKGVTSCLKCPKRTGSNPGLFAETQDVQKGDICTDPGCYSAKKEAFVQIRIAEEQRKAAPVAAPSPSSNASTPVKGMGTSFSQSAAKPAKAAPPVEIQKISIQEKHMLENDEKKKDVLYEGEFKIAKPGCKSEKKAIYVDGPKIGGFAFLCAGDSCKNHGFSHSSSGSGSGSGHAGVTFARRKEIWNQRVQLVHRDSLAMAILSAKAMPWGEEETQIVTQQLISLTSYQDQNKLRRIFGLGTESEFGQTKLKNHAKKLKGAELLRFILVIALAPELGLEDQYFGGNLKATDPLALVAGNYKIDADKHLTDAKAGLEKKRPKTDAEKAAALKAKESGPTREKAKAAAKPAKTAAKTTPVKKAAKKKRKK